MKLNPNELRDIVTKAIEESPKINQMDGRLTRVEDRLTRVEDRLTRVEDRLTRVEDRLTRVEDRLTRVEDRLGSIEQEFQEFRLIQEDMHQTLKLVLDAVMPAQKRGEQIEQISDVVDNHEIRITVVEDVVKDHLNEKA